MTKTAADTLETLIYADIQAGKNLYLFSSILFNSMFKVILVLECMEKTYSIIFWSIQRLCWYCSEGVF